MTKIVTMTVFFISVSTSVTMTVFIISVSTLVTISTVSLSVSTPGEVEMKIPGADSKFALVKSEKTFDEAHKYCK